MDEIKYLPIINRSDSCKVKVSDICFITRENRKLLFDTENGLKVTHGKINTLEKYLGPGFMRCMAGCIINLAKIREIRDGIIYFDDGATLRVGRDAYVKTKQKFNAYLRSMGPWSGDGPGRGEGECADESEDNVEIPGEKSGDSKVKLDHGKIELDYGSLMSDDSNGKADKSPE